MHCLSVKKQKPVSGILDYLGCLAWFAGGSAVSAIKMTVVKSSKVEHAIRLKGLIGASKELDKFFELFQNRM